MATWWAAGSTTTDWDGPATPAAISASFLGGQVGSEAPAMVSTGQVILPSSPAKSQVARAAPLWA